MKKCEFCEEAKLNIGEKTKYGAVVIYHTGGGDDQENSWFAVLSPRTGGDPETDFSIQLMPFAHLKYFSDINSSLELAKNYRIAFAKICEAVGKIIRQDNKIPADTIPIGTYGKCKHPDEHIHLKIFPYKDDIGQPFTTDSSFTRKEVHVDGQGGRFVKMKPVKKVNLPEKRFKHLADHLIRLLK